MASQGVQTTPGEPLPHKTVCGRQGHSNKAFVCLKLSVPLRQLFGIIPQQFELLSNGVAWSGGQCGGPKQWAQGGAARQERRCARLKFQCCRVLRRRVSFADVSKVMHEQNRALHHPPSPHPCVPAHINVPGPQEAGQPGSPGSLHLVHAPKKSALRPRGSKAPISLEDEHSQASPAFVTAESPLALPPQVSGPAASSVPGGVHRSKAALEANDSFQHSSVSTARSQLAWAGSAASLEKAATPRHAFQQEPARAGAQTVSVGDPGRSRSGRGEPGQDAPRAQGSLGALQAKLQRLKARWSALAEHGHPSHHAPTKPTKGASLASAQNRVTLSVSAGAPFTVFKLDDEEASGPSTFPPGDGHGTPGVGQTAPFGAEDTRGQHAGLPDEPAPSSDVGHAQPANEQLMSMLAGPGWEQQLGLPGGADLWGPTVLEVPESPRASAILAAACPILPTQRAARSVSTSSSGVIFVTEPGPIAESVEGQDVQCDVCEELDRSLSTSFSSQSKAMLPAGAPDPSIEYQSNPLAMSQGSEDSLAQSEGISLPSSHGSGSASALPEGQGDEESGGSDACRTRLPSKVLSEDQLITLTSPSVTDMAQTASGQASVQSPGQTEPTPRHDNCGPIADESPELCNGVLSNREGQEGLVLEFADRHEQGGWAAAASQADGNSLTLDQRLSINVGGHNKAGQYSQAVAWEQPSIDAMHAMARQDSLSEGEVDRQGAGMTAHASAAPKSSPEESRGAQACLNCSSNAAASAQVEVVHSIDALGAQAGAEPVLLDRGEPTFEDSMRQQTVQSHTGILNGRKAGQLLPHREQTPPHEPSHVRGSPQRSASPFARIMQAGRARAHEARPDPPTGLSRLLSMAGRQNEGAMLEQRPTVSFGPGPLETGWHEAERGGYYLTTPDPLRQDPGFAGRRRQTTSEHSAQSAAQHAQHGRDPLNWDPVQYESSPVWRKNTLTALESLHPFKASDAGPYPRQQPQRPEAEASDQMAGSATAADAAQGDSSIPEQPTHIMHKHDRKAMHARHRPRSSERPPTIRHAHKEDSTSSAADAMQRGKPRIQDRPGESRQRGKSRRRSTDSVRILRPWRARTHHSRQEDASAASLPVSGSTSGAEVCILLHTP